MSNETHDSKRLAKNTLVLYMRMLLTVGISFYTARVILAGLGVSDYGLYNVIGGFVAMFYMVTSTLSTAITRFLTFELGKGNVEKLRITFSTSINIMLILSLFIVLLGETLGLWFVNNKLVIEPDRLEVANWLYQLSLLCFVIEMISVPYHASIVAHEKMTAFAFVTISNVILKLIIALSISISPIDKLLFYSILMALVSWSTQIMYWVYCRASFAECYYQLKLDIASFKNMFGFAGWFFFTSISSVLGNQGINILLNLFFGTPVNAARGVAVQVDNTVKAFSHNFTTALSPQIIKSYAQGDSNYTKKLLYAGSKYSFLLLFIVSWPILLESNFLLGIWLKEVPPFATHFVQLTLLCSLLEVMLGPSSALNNATGDIKLYQIIRGGSQLLILPISYVVLRLGGNPASTLIVTLLVNIIIFVPRVRLNKKHISISFKEFFEVVILKCLFVLSITAIFTIPIMCYVEKGFVRMVIIFSVSLMTTSISIFFFALDEKEKKMLQKFISNAIGRIRRK